jgi:ATP-dependent Clp protease ATP-binding subunit ClpA
MLAEKGYDPEMGARPLRRVIQQRVEDKLSDALLGGDFQAGDTIFVDVEDEEIILRHEDDAKELLPPSEAVAAV